MREHPFDFLGTDRHPPGNKAARHLLRRERHPASQQGFDEDREHGFHRRQRNGSHLKDLLPLFDLSGRLLSVRAHIEELAEPFHCLPSDGPASMEIMQGVLHPYAQQRSELAVSPARWGFPHQVADGLLEGPQLRKPHVLVEPQAVGTELRDVLEGVIAPSVSEARPIPELLQIAKETAPRSLPCVGLQGGQIDDPAHTDQSSHLVFGRGHRDLWQY